MLFLSVAYSLQAGLCVSRNVLLAGVFVDTIAEYKLQRT